MATLIAVYNSEGCVGRCDARCYNAKGGDCDCICGGANHAVGRDRAEANVRAYTQRELERIRAAGGQIAPGLTHPELPF